MEVYVSPKISIVIPVFNSEDFLEQCLDSVLVQTFCEFEAICIDDSSTDESGSIISDYVKKDSRFIKLSNSENQGAGRTRNKGIDSARGEYIMFLDSDDSLVPNALEKVYTHTKETAADICCFPLSLAYPSKGQVHELPFSLDFSLLPKNFTQPFSCSIAGSGAFMFTNPSVCTKAFRREFLSNIGAQFTDYRVAEDLLFTYGAFIQTDRIAVMHDYLYRYNQEKLSSISKEDNNMAALVGAMDMLAQKLNDLNLSKNYEGALANLFLYHSSGALTLIKDAESLQTAFDLCESWKTRLRATNFDFLRPHYCQMYETICSGSPASYLMDTVRFMKKDAIYYETQITGYREAVDDLLIKETLLTEQNEALREELASLVGSRAFRFGTAALRIPSTIKKALKGLKN